MANIPCICLATAAAAPDLDKVWEAMGRGPGNFTQAAQLVTPSEDPEAITHYLMQDMNATESDEALWRAFAASADLPPIQGIWGEDGIISAADAQAASAGLTVYSMAGTGNANAWREGIIEANGLASPPPMDI